MPTLSPRQTLEHEPFPPAPRDRLMFLLNFATLAPSTHNTQPWLFRVEADYIDVFLDERRWLKIADADKRELHLSVGCALENLAIAAEHYGFRPRVTYFPDETNAALAARVELPPIEVPALEHAAPHFRALLTRHTNRGVYADKQVSEDVLEQLRACVTEDGLGLVTSQDVVLKHRIDKLMVEADARQSADPAWREELGHWMGAGAFGQAWLVAKLAQLAVTYLDSGKSTAKKDSEALMSAPVLAVLVSRTNDRLSQVLAGRAFERVFLTAEHLGLRLHPMNQVLQVPDLKKELSASLPRADSYPHLCFRLGYADAEASRSPRRPLREVLV